MLGTVMGVSLLTFFGVAIFGEPGAPGDEGRHRLDSTFSRSAVGHAAFRELLERLDVPVTVSRFRSGGRAEKTGVLLLIEPHRFSGNDDVESLEDTIDTAARVLVVLPKWDVERDDRKPELVASPVRFRPVEDVEEWLEIAGVSGKIVRPESLDVAGDGFPAPAIDHPQLIATEGLDAAVAGPDGVLLGRVRGRDVWVLSDPDVIENHGLVRGDNATFVLRAIRRVGEGRLGPVIIDETHHGYVQPPQVFRALFAYPLVVAMLHVGLLIAFVAWAGTGRFGPPRPEKMGIRPGKDVLIGNMAELLLVGRRSPEVLQKFFRNAVATVALRTVGRTGSARRDDVKRLARIGESRGLSVDLADLDDRVRDLARRERFDEGRAMALARDIHRWRKEFLDGA